MIKNANISNLINANLDYNTMNISPLDEGVESTPIISKSRKHKKQETPHFDEHKKGISQQEKEEK